VAAEVARVSGAQLMIERENFAAVLPAHIGEARFQRWALGILAKPELVEVARTPAGQLSIVTALLDCASLGLEPGRTYHLVPYKGIVKGMTDYKGEVQLIWNAVQRPVVASLVYSKDTFYMTGANLPPTHEADWFAEEGRGNIVGGYAYVQFGDGLYSLVMRMTEADFLKHKGKAQTQNVWDEWPEAMRLKTLVHQLRKWVPWSAEVRQP
jgi:recombination protein RecT